MRTLLEALRNTERLDRAAALLLALGPGLDASRGQYGPEQLELLGELDQPATLKVRVRSGVSAELGPFQAPEVAWGRGGSAAVAYLIAALLYERVTGQAPFPDAPPEALQVRKLLEPVPTLPPGAPDPLAELIPHALQPQVEDRLPLADLRQALAVVAGHPQPVAVPRRRAPVEKERKVASAADEYPSMHADLLLQEEARAPAEAPAPKDGRRWLVGIGLAAGPALLGVVGLVGAITAAALTLGGLAQASLMVALAVGLASLGLVALGLAVGAAGVMLTPASRAQPTPAPPPPAPLPASSSPSIFDESSIAADPPEEGFRPFAIGPYWCFGRVGEGAMGVVYRSRHMRLGRLAAVKVLAPQVALHASNVAWFKREARLAARIRHPNVVQIYDFGAIDGQLYYIAMEHVDGVPLTHRLSSGALPLRDVAAIVAQVGAGLDAAHASGVIHRDLKPDNVVVASRGGSVAATIVDFGIARQGGGGASPETSAMVVGTPPYMSPEQARGETDIDARTDVFALGVLAYELITGKLPFGAHSDRPVKALLERSRLSDRPPKARTFRPELSPAVDEALVRALAPERAQRAATAGAFAEELRRGLG